MTWVKLDEQFPEHRKVIAAGGDAAWLFICMLAYCNRNETDGVIPGDVVARLSDRRHPAKLTARLFDVGLLEGHPDGWLVHDYHEYQPSRAKLDAARDAARERMNKRRGSPNVRANNDRTSPEHGAKFAGSSDAPIPFRTVGITSSSVSTGVVQRNGDDDDDDDDRMNHVVELVVAGKERDHPPTRNARAWRKIVANNTRLEDGQVIRKLLDEGSTPEAVALFVLGHGDSTATDRQQKPWCTPSCETCDGTGWLFDPDLDGAIPCPQRS